MSLKLGSKLDTDKVDGLHAILVELPGSNPDVDTLNLPVGWGGRLSYVGVNPAKFLFNLVIEQDSVQQAMDLASKVTGALYPAAGLQTLEFNPLQGWQYQVIQDKSLEWQRDPELWPQVVGGAGKAVLTARLELMAPDPHGYRPDVAEDYTNSGAGKTKTFTFTRQQGNVPSAPVFTFTGTVAEDETVTVTLRDPGHTTAQRATVKGPVDSGDELVLDFSSQEFYTATDGIKNRNKADRFTVYEDIESGLGSNTATVSTTGTLNTCNVSINGKRI